MNGFRESILSRYLILVVGDVVRYRELGNYGLNYGSFIFIVFSYLLLVVFMLFIVVVMDFYDVLKYVFKLFWGKMSIC